MENNDERNSSAEADGEVGPIKENENKTGNTPGAKLIKEKTLEFVIDSKIMSRRIED